MCAVVWLYKPFIPFLNAMIRMRILEKKEKQIQASDGIQSW